MRAILLFVFLFSIETAFSQSIQLEIFNFSELGELHNMFITDDDKLVISSDSGVFLLEDSVILQRITPNRVNAFKGRFGNVIFASGQHGIESWTPTGSYIYSGDSSITLRDMYKAAQLPDGRIISFKAHVIGDLILFDSSTSIDLNGSAYVTPSYPWIPFIEVNPNLYFTKLTWFGQIGYFDALLDTLIEYPDSLLVSTNYGITHAAKGSGEKIFMTYVGGILEVENNTVQTVAYFAPLGFSFSNARVLTSCTYMDENYVVIVDSHLIFYKNGTIQLYGSAEGYNHGNLSGTFNASQFNSRGVLYVLESHNLMKITSPLTSIQGDFHDQQEINVSPNPFTNSLHLNNLKNDTDYFYTISEPSGKIISEASLDQNHRIDLDSRLAAGMYFLKVTDKRSGFQKSIRVIKSNPGNNY